ncbi:hypothetical protein [Streptomyces sp. NPDC002215]|uniref:hypothetical protein n=1 Tax=Streptomyces sp. NPDC002215 TaxID=3154412 RepID=UPI00331BDD98
MPPTTTAAASVMRADEGPPAPHPGGQPVTSPHQAPRTRPSEDALRAARARRAAEQLAVPCPWSSRTHYFWSGNETDQDIDVIHAAAELTWCAQHERAVSECPPAPPTLRPGWGTPQD